MIGRLVALVAWLNERPVVVWLDGQRWLDPLAWLGDRMTRWLVPHEFAAWLERKVREHEDRHRGLG